MQFKKVGNVVQVLRYSGYDREKRRSRVRLLGSFPTPIPSITSVDEALKDQLSDEEKKELHEYILADYARFQDSSNSRAARHLVDNIKMAIRGIDDGYPVDDGIWKALSRLENALERNGYERPSEEE